MNTIGGYFELELKKNREYLHSNSIKLNLARNALLYLLKANNYKKIFIPFFTCEAGKSILTSWCESPKQL